MNAARLPHRHHQTAIIAPAISLIMPTIDWGPPFDRCLQAAVAALGPQDELLVVFDGSPPAPTDWLLQSGATLLYSGERSGPAAARNLAAAQAHKEILLFVDADVELHGDAATRVRQQFQRDPELQAVFGSYDATPAAPGLVSRFRNLLHHHTHTSHPGPACTFWAGCGAVRRDRFLALGGFDAETYRQPCIEDIEFGLRLHDHGGRILLDPAIQGTHHKNWTLGLMVRTDIQQRAIPWSQLLLHRRQIPATLNLSPAARISAGLSLIVPIALMGLAVPLLWPWPLVALLGTLIPLLMLNRSFLGLLRRQGGLQLAVPGAGLHLLYLLYSSLSFLAVLLVGLASTPLPSPAWLKQHSPLLGNLARISMVLLTLLATLYALRGLAVGSTSLLPAQDFRDLYQRLDEWQLFRDGVYPSGPLASPEERALPYFRTTVYLPWALPLFSILFAWGGIWQGKIVILLFSLIALALMATIGWHCLRSWGYWASWVGALSPLAITGNVTCLYHGQFSIICMGLITLQWLLLNRHRPMAAGLCWALAMVKPQIAISYALPFLQRRRLSGLLLGSAVLLGLSAAALAHTRTSPLKLLISWFQVLPWFINRNRANFSGLGAMVANLQSLSPIKVALMICLLLGVAGIILVVLRRQLFYQLEIDPVAKFLSSDPLDLAGFCALVGMLGFYHGAVDNIMLYPTLLACWRETFLAPRWGNLLLLLLMVGSVWAPQSLLDLLPGSKSAQTLIWLLVAMVLLWRMLKGKALETSTGR